MSSDNAGSTTTTTTTTTTRRNPKQTCEDKRLDELERAKDAGCEPFPGKTCRRENRNDLQRLQLYPCSVIVARIAAVKVCVAARQQTQDECFKNATDPGHAEIIDKLIRGIMLCEALKAVPC